MANQVKTVSVVDIAKKMQLSPKVARRKLRSAVEDRKLTKPKEGWQFPVNSKTVTEVKRILRSD